MYFLVSTVISRLSGYRIFYFYVTMGLYRCVSRPIRNVIIVITHGLRVDHRIHREYGTYRDVQCVYLNTLYTTTVQNTPLVPWSGFRWLLVQPYDVLSPHMT